MATMYWIGADGGNFQSWNWSDTSGGECNYSTPASGDNVIFDEHSFNGDGKEVSVDTGTIIGTMDFSKCLYTPSFYGGSECYINGDLRLRPGMTLTVEYALHFSGASLQHIDLQGCYMTIGEVLMVDGAGGIVLDSNGGCTGRLEASGGNIDFGGKTWHCKEYEDTGSRTITFTGANITIDSAFKPDAGSTLLGTSTCIFTFHGDMDKSYNSPDYLFHDNTLKELHIKHGTDGTVNIYGSNTILDSFTIDAGTSSNNRVYFESDKTTTFGNNNILTCIGTDSYPTILDCMNYGTHTFTASDAGYSQSVDRCTVGNIIIGDGTFIATHSTDNGNTTGWSFITAVDVDTVGVVGSVEADAVAPVISTPPPGAEVLTVCAIATVDNTTPIIHAGLTVVSVAGASDTQGIIPALISSNIIQAITGALNSTMTAPIIGATTVINAEVTVPSITAVTEAPVVVYMGACNQATPLMAGVVNFNAPTVIGQLSVVITGVCALTTVSAGVPAFMYRKYITNTLIGEWVLPDTTIKLKGVI